MTDFIRASGACSVPTNTDTSRCTLIAAAMRWRSVTPAATNVGSNTIEIQAIRAQLWRRVNWLVWR